MAGHAFLGGPPPQRRLRRRRRNAARRAVQPREVHPRLRDMSRTCRGRVLDVRSRERCVRTMSSSSSRQASMARSSACAVRESSRTSCFSSRTAYLRDMSRTCLGRVLDVSWTCPGRVRRFRRSNRPPKREPYAKLREKKCSSALAVAVAVSVARAPGSAQGAQRGPRKGQTGPRGHLGHA